MLEESLELLNVSELKERLKLLDTRERPTRKADLVALIRAHLLSPRCRDYYDRLDPLEREAVAEAVHLWDGVFSSARFHARHGEVPAYFRSRGFHSRRNAPPPYRGVMPLFFFSGRIPGDLRTRLAEFVPVPQQDRMRTVDEADLPTHFVGGYGEDVEMPVKRLAMEPVVRHDLPALLRLVSDGRVTVSEQTGQAGAAAVKLLEATLLGGDFYGPGEDEGLERWAGGAIRPIRPFAWPLLLQSGGLVRRNGRRLELTPKGRKALDAPLEETVKGLYVRWCAKGMLDEFRRVDLVKGQSGKGRRMTAVAGRRQAVEAVLEDCPLGRWIAVDELFRYMQAVGHELEVAHDYWKLYVSDSHYGSLGNDGYHAFGLLQGRYILVYLFEYLATLGMVDLVYTLPYGARPDFGGMWGTDEFAFFSRYDGLLHFRINPLGAYCLGLADAYLPSPIRVDPLLVVDEELNLTLLREPDPGERLLLEQYAEARAAGYWQVTPRTLFAAMGQGRDLQPFKRFLAERAAASLPAEAERLFDTLSERRAAIRDAGPARLLRCESAALAHMIATDPATRPYCLPAGERLLAVPRKSESDLRKALAGLGYLFPGED